LVLRAIYICEQVYLGDGVRLRPEDFGEFGKDSTIKTKKMGSLLVLDLGKYREAEGFYLRVPCTRSTRERGLGSDHHSTLDSLQNAGVPVVLCNRGKYDVRVLHARACRKGEAGGPQSRRSLETVRNMALAYGERYKYTK